MKISTFRKRRLTAAFSFAFAGLVLAAAASWAQMTLAPEIVEERQPQRHEVAIHGFVIEPAALAVAPGDIIVWTNKDIAPHTASALDGSWDSGQLNKNESWEMVVTAETSLNYLCLFHPQMTAKLTRGEAE